MLGDAPVKNGGELSSNSDGISNILLKQYTQINHFAKKVGLQVTLIIPITAFSVTPDFSLISWVIRVLTGDASFIIIRP